MEKKNPASKSSKFEKPKTNLIKRNIENIKNIRNKSKENQRPKEKPKKRHLSENPKSKSIPETDVSTVLDSIKSPVSQKISPEKQKIQKNFENPHEDLQKKTVLNEESSDFIQKEEKSSENEKTQEETHKTPKETHKNPEKDPEIQEKTDKITDPDDQKSQTPESPSQKSFTRKVPSSLKRKRNSTDSDFMQKSIKKSL